MRECVLKSWPKFVLAVYSLCSLSLFASGACDKALFYKFIDRPANLPATLKETALKPSLRFFRFPSANRLFEERFKNTTESDTHLFFHLENQKLKALNDAVLGNKDASAALINLHKKILFELLQSDPVLLKLQVPVGEGGVYSDYKTLRIAFEVKSQNQKLELKKRLEVLLREAAERFESETRTLRLSDTPTLWHLAGIGSDPERAALAAKWERERKYFLERDTSPLPRLGEFDPHLETAVKEKLEEIRKDPSRAGDLAPALYVKDEEALFLFSPEEVKHGLVSIDFAGLGLKNREAVFRLAQEMSPDATPNEILRALRNEQEKVSQEFENNRENLIRVLESFQKDRSQRLSRFSGDELVWASDRVLSQRDLVALWKDLNRALPSQQRIRILVQPQTYQDSSVFLDPAFRLEWAGKMESFEKKLQEGLSKSIGSLLILEPKSPKQAALTLVVESEDRALFQKRLEQIQQENHFPHFDQIRLINPLF